MDIVEIYRSYDMLIYEIYYASYGRIDKLVTFLRKKGLVYRTNTEIQNYRIYKKKVEA